ncbi:serine/threonine-protein kinase [Nocardiopsis halophila]|uniref:serine/threonine-protein kinase n=1 Tax=Nocardiopsis halophila TaxID=141692 RepID=UPI000345E298|nr:serine/threonine-protein kinase [Nocardiopsis halophila]
MRMADPLEKGDPRRVGPYRIQGRLGSGSTGRVYLGRSRGGRPVAVKVVAPELADDEDFRRHFAPAVAAARGVGGLSTAQVVDAGPEADPPWLATAYIPGPTLARAVAEHGPLGEDGVRVLGAGLAEGLGAVHTAGLVHGRLGPGEVILAEDGPRVTDFALARAVEAAHPSLTVDAALGRFLAPEQVLGSGTGPAADVFALAGVLVFAATGRAPFGDGQGGDALRRVVEDAPDLTGVPGALTGLLGECFAKDPGARPALADVLFRLSGPGAPGGPGAHGWPPGVAAMIRGERAPAARRPGRRTVLLAAGAGALAAAAVPAGLFLAGRREDGGDGGTGGGEGGGEAPAEATLTLAATLDLDAGEAFGPIAFSGDGAVLAVGLDDGVALWETESRSERTRLPITGTLVQDVAFGPGGLLVGGYRAEPDMDFGAGGEGLVMDVGEVAVWEVAAGGEEEIAAVATESEGGTQLEVMTAVAVSPDGATIAGARSGGPAFGQTVLWDAASEELLETLVIGEDQEGGDTATAGARSVAFSPDGTLLAVGYGNGDLGGGVVLFDTGSYSPVATLSLDDTGAFGVTELAFSPDGSLLAGAFSGIALWDVESRELVHTLGGAEAGFQTVAFSPDGAMVASGGYHRGSGGEAYLWDVSSGEYIASAVAGRSGPADLAFSPDGRILAVTTDGSDLETVVQLWEVAR